jgi:DNA protecting protein DprA
MQLGDELHRQGVQILVRGKPDYPARLTQVLGETAPPVLFAKGNLSILERKTVGFCGSRKTSAKGLRIARESARLLAESDINIASGYANGTDLAAHCGALAVNGATTFVLVEGILNFRIKPEVAELLNEENYVAVSEFPPEIKWIARNAMQRNRTICGLSDAMIMVESGLSGGTFAAGETTLQLNQPLFVVEYAEPPKSAEGNRYFLDKDARPLLGNRKGKPLLDAVFEILAKAGEPIESYSPKQGALFSETDAPKKSPQPQVTTVTEPVERIPPMNDYPKRLIEVDLPIKRISAHARREKSIRHGHISTLHIWWARRPLAACRAVLCAALWPDPTDANCPERFRVEGARIIGDFAKKAARDLANTCQTDVWKRWEVLAKRENPLDADNPDDLNILRYRLLDFIADFANWDNATQPDYLAASRALTQAAHESLGGIPGTRPLVADSFAGGGAIPLEALRVGADAFASDLNPVAVLLNKVVLEYIPKYGETLAAEVRRWGEYIKDEAEKELGGFYPRSGSPPAPLEKGGERERVSLEKGGERERVSLEKGGERERGGTPIAYLWARTVVCEGPGCGAEVPLMRSLWLAKKNNKSVALRLVPNLEGKRVDFEIIEDARAKDVRDGTVKRGSATCPCCGFTTPVASVRKQLKPRRGGADDARLFCVVTVRDSEKGRFYRLPNEVDLEAVKRAREELERRKAEHRGELSLVPDEPTPQGGGSGAGRAFSQRNYGMNKFEDLFASRQALALSTLARLVNEVGEKLVGGEDEGLAIAVQCCLAFIIDKQTDYNSSLCTWNTRGEYIGHTFGRQALPMVWDFIELQPFGDGSGNIEGAVDWTFRVIEQGSIISDGQSGSVGISSAVKHPLPSGFAQCFFSDPPYYDAVPYADLSDFFYVWLKRTLPPSLGTSFANELAPKDDECIVDEVKGKDKTYFETQMAKAMAEGCRILSPNGIGVIVFAHKSTAGWESQLQAMINAGWTITASWAIDTEMGNRLRAMNSAALASSIHLVCRRRSPLTPLEKGGTGGGTFEKGGTGGGGNIGDWRDVLQELPQRIRQWMPRLADQGIVGADAIFACLGPALEIFSRHDGVEKASGEVVTLREYLEYVWAAVSKEALSTIFADADTADFEPDARLTAMWLWTLTGGTPDSQTPDSDDEEEDIPKKSAKPSGGYVLEYDTARKIAQGLGADLAALSSLVEIKGGKARLLAVAERSTYLLGKDKDKDAGKKPTTSKKKSKNQPKQLDLFSSGEPQTEATDSEWGDTAVETPGQTVLDRIHQAAILFAAGRSDALKRFLVEDAIGKDKRFWVLAQALSALYPRGTEEKRWVDGVLARKKGLGL